MLLFFEDTGNNTNVFRSFVKKRWVWDFLWDIFESLRGFWLGRWKKRTGSQHFPEEDKLP